MADTNKGQQILVLETTPYQDFALEPLQKCSRTEQKYFKRILTRSVSSSCPVPSSERRIALMTICHTFRLRLLPDYMQNLTRMLFRPLVRKSFPR